MTTIDNPYLKNTDLTTKYSQFHILYREHFNAFDHVKTLIGLWTSVFTDKYEETIWFKGQAHYVTIEKFRYWWLQITRILGITTVGWVIIPQRNNHSLGRTLTVSNDAEREVLDDIIWYVKATSTSTYKPRFAMEDLSARALYVEINRPYESLTEWQQAGLREAIKEEACKIGFIHPDNYQQRSYSPTGELFTSWTHHVKGHRFILKETLTRDV